MKNFIILLALISQLTSSIYAIEVGNVILIAGKSPCAGGPTNCVSIAKNGSIEITDQAGNVANVNINKAGVTKISLQPGSYQFNLLVSTPAKSRPVVQDIIAGKDNLVYLEMDTGIR